MSEHTGSARHDAMATKQQETLAYWKDVTSGTRTTARHPCWSGMGPKPSSVFHDVLTTAKEADVDAILTYVNGLSSEASLQYALDHLRVKNKRDKADKLANKQAKADKSLTTEPASWGLLSLSPKLKLALKDTSDWLTPQEPARPASSSSGALQPAPSAVDAVPRTGRKVSKDQQKKARGHLNNLIKRAEKKLAQAQGRPSASSMHSAPGVVTTDASKRSFDRVMSGGEGPAKKVHSPGLVAPAVSPLDHLPSYEPGMAQCYTPLSVGTPPSAPVSAMTSTPLGPESPLLLWGTPPPSLPTPRPVFTAQGSSSTPKAYQRPTCLDQLEPCGINEGSQDLITCDKNEAVTDWVVPHSGPLTPLDLIMLEKYGLRMPACLNSHFGFTEWIRLHLRASSLYSCGCPTGSPSPNSLG
eukprot:m.87622 g.87622  ORF g.87622 m.87622 type:complete len:413 (-) comp14785_c0_seq8:9-1247(-)